MKLPKVLHSYLNKFRKLKNPKNHNGTPGTRKIQTYDYFFHNRHYLAHLRWHLEKSKNWLERKIISILNQTSKTFLSGGIAIFALLPDILAGRVPSVPSAWIFAISGMISVISACKFPSLIGELRHARRYYSLSARDLKKFEEKNKWL